MINKTKTIEWFVTMIVLAFFVVVMGQLIYLSSTKYADQLKNETQLKEVLVASGYIEMKIKQNDISEHIQFMEQCIENYPGLKITHSGSEDGYVTYIFYAEGNLYECYTDSETVPEIALSELITPIHSLKFELISDRKIQVLMEYEFKKQLYSKKMIIAQRAR